MRSFIPTMVPTVRVRFHLHKQVTEVKNNLSMILSTGLTTVQNTQTWQTTPSEHTETEDESHSAQSGPL